MSSESRDEERLAREAAFHDVAFAGDTRASASKFYDLTGASTRRYHEAILALAPGRRALEYGCGPGSQAFALARAGADVSGIDISPVAIDIARARAEREGLSARFTVMDAEHLEFPDDSFDLICGTSILHHLDMEQAVSEIGRVLAPGGRAVFAEPMGHNPLINAYRRRTPEMRTPDEHPLLDADLALIARSFGHTRFRHYHLATLAAMALYRTRLFPAAVRALDALDRLLLARLPALRRHAWMVVLEAAEPVSAGQRA